MKIEKMLLILIVVFAFSRILFLDADPLLFNVGFYMSDEGRWSQEARNQVLFGEWITDDFSPALASAPLYVFLLFIIFKLFNVHLFTARLISALPGILSIFLLYFIVKKHDQRLAVIAAFILAIDNAFFTYNRIGFPESLYLFFLLLSFFFLTSGRSNFHYLSAGACFMLAVLSKLSAIYFSVSIFFYLAALYLRKETNLKGILIYLVGFLLVAVPALFFYYIPLYPVLEPSMKVFARPWLPIFFPFRISYFALNSYFSYPSIFLLLILSLIYLKERKILTFLTNIKQNIKLLDEIELMAFSWFFGLLIAVVFSDFIERRFTPLIIPLVLFSSMLLDKREKYNFKGEERINLLTFIILLVPFLNLMRYPNSMLSNYVNLRPIVESTLPPRIFSMIEQFGYIFDDVTITKLALISLYYLIAITLVVLYVTILRHKSKYKDIIDKYLPKFSLIALLLALSFNLIYRNSTIVFSYINIPTILIVLIGVPLSVLLFISIRKHTFFFKKIFLSAYVIFCILLITYTLLFPSFTAKNASAKMSNISDEGEWIVGVTAHTLSFENKLRPLFWVPNRKDMAHVNKDAIEKYKPKYYQVTHFYGEKMNFSKSTYPRPDQLNGSLVYLDTFELWPIFRKPRVIVDLYEIDRSRKYEENQIRN